MIGETIQWFNSNAGAVQGIAAIITAIVTLCILAITWRYVRSTHDMVRLQVEPQVLITPYQESALLIRNRGMEQVVNLKIELTHFVLIRTPSGWKCPRFSALQPNVASRAQLDVGDTWESDLRNLVDETVAESVRFIEPKMLFIHATVTVQRRVDRREYSFRKRFVVIPGTSHQRNLIVDMQDEFLAALMPDFPEHEIERFIRSFNRPLQPQS